ncbi:phosphohydrolase [Marinitoga sp. 1135]|uniref:Putative domain HDIG-containing protein n=2 Tax=Marinitoga TaxID=160798 RepID=H2J2T3_MARPK|nr:MULTISPECIES: HD-GYP domain-containing protein [Marinitoga]AEX84527.1 putative domain HDIG-containing protein [Marinitoga piezophila KA3]APT75018.1 phosphohydrolase [Marinitoga sp. 1137]NUU94774.1 phosphohydrolase [Marinitoga sp. 1135]NUU96703.1 phosphohydrolase [Marinitoga sp. 1138]
MINCLMKEMKIVGLQIKQEVYGEKNEKAITIDDNIKIYTEIEIKDLEKILTLKNMFYNISQDKAEEIFSTKCHNKNILESVNLITENFKLESILKSIEETIRNLLNSDGAAILLYNEEKDVLNFYVTSGGASGKIETIDVPIDDSIAGECFLKKETIIINDTTKSKKHFKKTDEKSKYHTRNLIATPLFFENEVIGVLEAVNKKKGKYTDQDKEIMEIFSSLISNKLKNSKVYDDLSSTIKGLIQAVATAIDLRDNYTHTHSKNVSVLAVEIAKKLGYNDSFIEELEIAGLLHDVGKIGIPDNILNKPSKLTDEEYEIIKSHTIIGANLLSDIDFLSKNIPLGALEHHEKNDGSGYPTGKKGNEISLFGKILAVVDIYDALTAKRIYKEPWPKEKVLKILEKDCPKKFDCEIVEALKETVMA